MTGNSRNPIVGLQPLEPRQLMAFEEWGEEARLVRLPDAIAQYQPLELNGAGQTVAVIDSGIDYTHPALGGGFGPGFRVVGGYDFVDNDNDPKDTFGHGTNVAGIIGGVDYVADGTRHRGIAPGVKFVALRVDKNGQTSVPDSRIEQSLQWVIDHRAEFGITIVNISYGTGSYDEEVVSNVYGDEIEELHKLGVVIVASSGNEGLNDGLGIDAPAANEHVISVGSVDVTDKISNFSERGDNLDILAPGEFVYTTLLTGGFGAVDGTSFAAPAVTGTIALMKQFDPSLRPQDVESILLQTGKPNFDGDTESAPTSDLTFPRLDVLAALELTNSRLPGTPEQQSAFGQFGNGNALAVDRFGITHFVYYDAKLRTMLYSTRSTTGVWSATQTVDNSLPFQGYYLSITVDKTGRPAIAYFDGQNGDLKYATYDGTAWTHESVDVKNSTGAYPTIKLDKSGLPIIAYYRKTSGDLRVARRSIGGTWTISAVDTNGDVGRSTSMAIDRNGKIGIAYEDSTNGDLKYATRSDTSTNWGTITVDRSPTGVAFLSTTFDKNDVPLISYYDASPADLKVARFSNRRWNVQRLANRGATGLFTTLAVNDDNNPQIVYYDKRQNATFLAASTKQGWQYSKLQTGAGRFLTGVADPMDNVLRYSYLDTSDYKLRFGEVPL